MIKSNVILTGFMATGKTTVGKLLASALGFEFVDTDLLIAERARMSVPDIFKEKGEAAFRQMESDLAQELGEKQGLVIATGGRFMLDPGNAVALSRNAEVFCLVATPQEIMARALKDGQDKRPLLDTDDPARQVVDLMARRQAAYGKFIQISTSQKTPDQVMDHLMAILEAG